LGKLEIGTKVPVLYREGMDNGYGNYGFRKTSKLFKGCFIRDEKITSPVSVSCQHRELRLISCGG